MGRFIIPLYTIISLTVSIAGAMYAAMAGIRQSFQEKISSVIAKETEADAFLKDGDYVDMDKARNCVESLLKKMKSARWCYSGFSVVPLILFTIAIIVFYIHLWVGGWDDGCKISMDTWPIYKWSLGGFLLVNLVILLIFGVAGKRMFEKHNELKDAIESYEQIKIKKNLNKPEDSEKASTHPTTSSASKGPPGDTSC